MTTTKLIMRSATVLLLATVVLGAPSNSSTSGGVSGGLKRVSSPISSSSTSQPGGRPNTNTNTNVNVARGGSNNSTKNSSLNSQSSSQSVKANNGSSGSPSALGFSGSKKVNSTRVARSSDKNHEDVQSDDFKSANNNSSSSGSGSSIPSTHPLFAQRQTSNITSVLRPKLKGQSGSTSEISSPSSSSSEEDGPKETKHTVNDSDSPVTSVRKSSSVDDESAGSVSVISTEPVSIQSRNSTRPKVRGDVLGNRRPSSSTHAPIEDDEQLF